MGAWGLGDGNPFGGTLLGNVFIFTDGMQSFPYPGGEESSLMDNCEVNLGRLPYAKKKVLWLE